jgi:hypothetical protein
VTFSKLAAAGGRRFCGDFEPLQAGEYRSVPGTAVDLDLRRLMDFEGASVNLSRGLPDVKGLAELPGATDVEGVRRILSRPSGRQGHVAGCAAEGAKIPVFSPWS